LLGGAFGMAAQVILHDKSIQPGAFALVGMAAFYAGIANTPLAALVMVCEVAGSYELLVPLMLTEAIAMIALRKVNLYPAQPRSTKDSPVHASPLATLRCGDVVVRTKPFATLRNRDTLHAATDAIEAAPDQDVFPVLDDAGTVVGLLSAEALRGVFSEDVAAAIVADVMVEPLTLRDTDGVRGAAVTLVRRDLRAAPVVDAEGKILGMLDQHDIVRAITAGPAPGESMG
jgi:CIC family chloride channel protein